MTSSNIPPRRGHPPEPRNEPVRRFSRTPGRAPLAPWREPGPPLAFRHGSDPSGRPGLRRRPCRPGRIGGGRAAAGRRVLHDPDRHPGQSSTCATRPRSTVVPRRAARVRVPGGRHGRRIMANSTRPAEFLYDNMLIHGTVVEASKQVGVTKLLYLGQLVHLPAPRPPADHRGPAPHRPARADQRGVRPRQDHRHQAVRGLPPAVRLQLHLGHAHQPLRARRQLRPGRPPRADADAPLPRGAGRPASRRSRCGARAARAASCCTWPTWPTPASS